MMTPWILGSKNNNTDLKNSAESRKPGWFFQRQNDQKLFTCNETCGAFEH